MEIGRNGEQQEGDIGKKQKGAVGSYPTAQRCIMQVLMPDKY